MTKLLFSRFTILVLLAAIQLLAGVIVTTRTPMRLLGWTPFRHPESTQPIVHFGCWLEVSEDLHCCQFGTINLDTDEVKQEFVRNHGTFIHPYDSATVVHRIEFLEPFMGRNRDSRVRYRWTRIDAESNRTISCDEFQFVHPRPYGFGVLLDRFLVGCNNVHQVEVLDLKNVDSPAKVVKFSATPVNVQAITGSACFIIETEVAAKVNGNSQRKYQLYRLADDGTPHGVTEFFAATIGNWKGVGLGTERIHSVDPSLKYFEVRSTHDGTILKKYPVPARFDLVKFDWGFGFYSGLFTIKLPSEYEIFDVARGGPAYRPKHGMTLAGELPGRALQLWNGRIFGPVGNDDRTTLYVFDPAKQEVLSEIETSARGYFGFVDAERFYHETSHFGSTFAIHSTATGTLIRIVRPFAWLVWAAPLLIASFCLLSFFWIRVSVSTGTPPWIDMLLLAGIPIVWITTRLLIHGDTSDLSRYPYSHLHGILLALVASSAVYLAFGTHRPSIRVLPIGLLVALQLAIHGQVLEMTPRKVADGFLLTTLTAGAVLAVCLLIRFMGWRILQREPILDHNEKSNAKGVPLKDVFFITTMLAFVFASSGAMHESFREITMRNPFDDFLYWLVGIAIVIAPLAFTRIRLVASTVSLAAFSALGAAIALPLHRFATAGYDFGSYAPAAIPTALVFAACLWGLLMPFRMRGWRMI